MVDEKIKKIIEDNNIPDDAEIKPIGMAEFASMVVDILQAYTGKLVDELNDLQFNSIKGKTKEEIESINLLTKLFNTMLNAAIPEALEYTMSNLPELMGLTDKSDDDFFTSSECDGVA